MIKTTIKRACDYLRTYEVNGKEIESICIYKDGEILLNTRQSWLENCKEDLSHEHMGDLIEVTFDGEVKRANKLNLNRKDNFLFRIKRDFYLHSGYTLFINVDNIFATYDELPKKENKGYFMYGYKVKLKYSAKKYELYLKYYNKCDDIEEEDRRKDFHNAIVKDENGKAVRDENGKFVIDENKFYCSRRRVVETKDCIFNNGRYIEEGR